RLVRELGALEIVVVRFRRGGRRHVVVRFCGVGGGKAIGGKRLELHGIGARRSGGIDHSAAQIHVAVVIDTGLRDDVARCALRDAAIPDRDRIHTATIAVCRSLWTSGRSKKRFSTSSRSNATERSPATTRSAA